MVPGVFGPGVAQPGRASEPLHLIWMSDGDAVGVRRSM